MSETPAYDLLRQQIDGLRNIAGEPTTPVSDGFLVPTLVHLENEALAACYMAMHSRQAGEMGAYRPVWEDMFNPKFQDARQADYAVYRHYLANLPEILAEETPAPVVPAGGPKLVI